MGKFLSNGAINSAIALTFLLLLSTGSEAAAKKPALRIAYLPILDPLTRPIAYGFSSKGKFEHFELQPKNTL